tara:strand:+ start:825 stop:1142 length:318 start_codon:yes stop_codon:yes gene_type:complete
VRRILTSDEGLEQAKRLVATKALAPLARVYASQPRDPLNFYAPQWRERLRAAEAEVIETLRAAGARVDRFDDGCVRILFAGVWASSRQGLRKALQHWKINAEAKR